MISASIYIAWCSAKNRLLARLRRLREPRYLIGAVVGVAYFYLTIFARGRRGGVVRVGGRGGPGPQGFPPVVQAAVASIGGILVFVLALLVWLLPGKSGLLDFSEAERMFLFTAPVTRRQLLVHRVIRSQIGSLVASIFIAIFATPLSGLGRIRLAIGFWVLLVTMRIYYAGVTLTRARLKSATRGSARVAWLPLALLAGGFLVVAQHIFREFRQSGVASFSDVMVRLARATSTGAPKIVLWPFVAVLRPAFTTSTELFLPALGAAVAVLIAVTAWVLANGGMLDAVAGDAPAGDAAVDARKAKATVRARNVGFSLALTGRPELALFWKGAVETLRSTGTRAWRFVFPVIAICAGLTSAAMGASGLRGPASVICLVAGLLAGIAIVFGPQIMRSDLRTDLEHLDLLKTWPMRAGDVIRGEMAWPIAFVSIVAWTAIFVSAVFSGAAVPAQPFISRWSFAIAAALAGPALISAQYTVHSAATLFFPAWVQLGSQRTRGIDAMGQRLIMLLAIVLSLAAFALPGALGGGVVWLLLHGLLGNVVFVPAAVVFAGLVLVEVLVVTELLGPAYERIDVTSIERPE